MRLQFGLSHSQSDAALSRYLSYLASKYWVLAACLGTTNLNSNWIAILEAYLLELGFQHQHPQHQQFIICVWLFETFTSTFDHITFKVGPRKICLMSRKQKVMEPQSLTYCTYIGISIYGKDKLVEKHNIRRLGPKGRVNTPSAQVLLQIRPCKTNLSPLIVSHYPLNTSGNA